MDKYICGICGYIYDPERGESRNGTSPGTAFEISQKNGIAHLVVLVKYGLELQNDRNIKLNIFTYIFF